MIKYIYFPTKGNQWFEAPLKLYNKGIAEPILWLGDDIHFEKAKKVFGDFVFKDLKTKHRPYLISKINYNGEYNLFFESINYLIAKDRCLKMMDRLDLYGMFSRIDREAYFHNISVWALKHIFNNKPDFLLTSENPHGHAQYLIYQICIFLNIPIYKFTDWHLAPVLFLQNEISKEIIYKSDKSYSKIDKKTDEDIKVYIDKFSIDPINYSLPYMDSQKKNKLFYSKVMNFFSDWNILNSPSLLNYLKDIKHNSNNLIRNLYNPINPYNLNFFTRLFIQLKRKNNIRKAIFKQKNEFDLNEKFIYFPLHFEPERTTNPDGDFFQDQLIAILKLRSAVPDNIFIYVKEHPSQLLMADDGSRGRSPVFYNILGNIKNVKFLSPEENSIELINHSLFTSTICGSVSLESAIIGKKSIIFGSCWFDGCPNIYKWNKNFDYHKFINSPIFSVDEIQKFILNKKRLYTIPGFQNFSKMLYFKNYNNNEFYKNQLNAICGIIEDLIHQKFHEK